MLINVDRNWVHKRLVTGSSHKVHGGVIDVTGSLKLEATDREFIAVLGDISGDLDCSGSELSSLENAPESSHLVDLSNCKRLLNFTGLNIKCEKLVGCGCTNLSSFGASKIRATEIDISNTGIKNLHGIHMSVQHCESLRVSSVKSNVLGIFFISGLKELESLDSNDAHWLAIVNRYLSLGLSGFNFVLIKRYHFRLTNN